MTEREHQFEEARERTRRTEHRDPDGSRSWIAAVGNAAATRLLGRATLHRSGTGKTIVDETVAGAIHAKRGGGKDLDPAARDDLGAAMGHDFSDVRIHTDAEADGLNKAVRAEAFTTGRDVFFRAGKYDPASNQGRKLLAHELTHVVQQRNAPPAAELSVSDPGDASERQATAVADHVTSPAAAPAPVAAVSRQEDEEEVQTSPLAREDEEEEEVATTPLAREGEEEEEEVATTPVAREGEEEEEEQPAG
jgi:hypothetical protein